ncbi:MAG: ABC transporter permease subunit [Planctomycetes bacterium]|nr:ABC transporter permease subunit [Planctomycetota bacterium]
MDPMKGVDAASGRRKVSPIQGVRIIFQRETSAYFDSSIATIYAAVFLVLSSSIFMNSFFLNAAVEMDEYFRTLPFLLVLFIPAITMRSWSEERSQGTIELILTLPVRPFQIILGKYLAALLFYLAVLAGSLPIAFMLLWLGRPDLKLIASSYLGAAFLGSFFLALGIFLSGLTREQIVAFVLATFACALFVLSGQEQVVEVLDGLTRGWQLGTWLYESVSVLPHYQSFCRGVIALGDLAYFMLLSACFLILNAVTLRIHKY